MSRKVTLRSAARAEYSAATKWYEKEKSGLGGRFEMAVEAVFSKIADDPLHFAEEYADVRYAPVEGFQHYCVYYRVRPGRISVISVFHSSRDPSVWQSRA
jgi:plasmid stabilization system protein ParE